jgi:TM2 domain-containing membrane protein YozV
VYNAGAPQAGYTAAQYPEPYVGSAAAVQNLVPGQVVQTAFGPIMVGQKSKLAAGLLGIFLGSLGIGRFYRGFTGLGVAQLAVTIVTCGVGALWGFIEGIMVLVAQPGTDMSKDAQGYLMSS